MNLREKSGRSAPGEPELFNDQSNLNRINESMIHLHNAKDCPENNPENPSATFYNYLCIILTHTTEDAKVSELSICCHFVAAVLSRQMLVQLFSCCDAIKQ